MKQETTLLSWAPQLLNLLFMVDELWSPKGTDRTTHMQMEPVPAAVLQATEQFLSGDNQSVVEDFLKDHCEELPTAKGATLATEVKKAFITFASRENQTATRKQALMLLMAAVEEKPGRDGTARCLRPKGKKTWIKLRDGA